MKLSLATALILATGLMSLLAPPRVIAGQLDIQNNLAVIRSADYASGLAWSGTLATGLFNGRNGGDWAGTGGTGGNAIMSSFAHADYLSHGFEYTAVGTIFNSDLIAIGYTPFTTIIGLIAVGNYDNFLAYTYAGDANLDGVIDHWDFDLFAIGESGAGRISWLTGDFNYDGVVNAADRSIMERNYTQQSEPLGLGWTPTPVPEPGTSALLGFSALVALIVRRARR